MPGVSCSAAGTRVVTHTGGRQNNRAFFLRSFLFQRARRSNSSTLIPNTSWKSSGDRCLCKQTSTQRGAVRSSAAHAAGPAPGCWAVQKPRRPWALLRARGLPDPGVPSASLQFPRCSTRHEPREGASVRGPTERGSSAYPHAPGHTGMIHSSQNREQPAAHARTKRGPRTVECRPAARSRKA